MPVDGAFWRSLRADFESLQGYTFTLIWNSSPPLSFAGEPLDSHWSWLQFPDDSLRARLSAIALRGARALGYDSEQAWYDRLRTSGFVGFQLSGSTRQRRSDGVMVDSNSGQIDDVVKESLTLCCELEAENAPRQALKTGKRRGRRPHQERRDAIRNAILMQGDEWRDHLDAIFTELDRQDVPLGDLQSVKIDLGDGKSSPVSTWTDLDLADGEQRKQIIDALRKYTGPTDLIPIRSN